METNTVSSSHLNNVENNNKQMHQSEQQQRYTDKAQGLIQMVQQLSPSIIQQQNQGSSSMTRVRLPFSLTRIFKDL